MIMTTKELEKRQKERLKEWEAPIEAYYSELNKTREALCARVIEIMDDKSTI